MFFCNGFFFEDEPFFTLNTDGAYAPGGNLPSLVDNYKTRISNKVYTNGRLTSFKAEYSYTFPAFNAQVFYTSITARTAPIPVKKNLITSLFISVSSLDAKGGLRRATITGTAGASYIIWVTRSNGNTYDFTNNVFLASTQQRLEGVLDSSGSFTVPITFPANSSGDSYIVRASGNIT